MERIARVFLPVLFTVVTASCGFAQRIMEPKISAGYSFAPTDATPLCASGYAGAHSCWTIQPLQSPGFTQVIPSQGHVIGTISTGCAYLYSDPITGGSNSWTQQTAWGCGLSYVSYGSDGNLYALTGSCLTTGHYVSKLVGSAWKQIAGCFTSFSLDQMGSGTIAAIDVNGALWESINYGVSFAKNQGCSANKGALSVVVLHSTQIGLVCSDNTIWYGPVNKNTYIQIAGSAVMVGGKGPTLYVIGTGNTNLYRFNIGMDTSWTELLSPVGHFTFLGYGDDSNVWTVHVGQTRYGPIIRAARYFQWALGINRVYNATTICQGTCPNQSSNPPVYHTATSHFIFTVKGMTVASSNTASSGHVNPTDQLALKTSLAVTGESFIQCFINSADCVVLTDAENYDCSEEGTLNSGGGGGGSSVIDFKAASEHSLRTGPPYLNPDDELYKYPVKPECSNTITPMLNPNYVMAQNSNDSAFDVSGVCVSLFGGPYHCFLPYTGDGALAIKEYPEGSDPGPQLCDTN